MGNPSLSATNTATVTIPVNRNNNPPRFLNLPYSGAIDYTAVEGRSIEVYMTTDADTVVCIFQVYSFLYVCESSYLN